MTEEVANLILRVFDSYLSEFLIITRRAKRTFEQRDWRGGRRDAAFDWWTRAIEGRDPLVMPVKSYPFFDPVREELRYRAMLRLMNLAER